MNIISDEKVKLLNTIINDTEINPSSIKVAGSFLMFDTDYGDIDLFIKSNDHIALAQLLHYGSRHAIYHIIPVHTEIFDNLHQYMSWNQCCVAYCLDGTFSVGDNFTDNKILSFNSRSTKYFKTYSNIISAGIKLTNHGFQLSNAEELKALYHIMVTNNKPQLDKDLLLNKIAMSQLGDTISDMIVTENGIAAGGYFRDIITGKMPKDMDIFIPSSGNWNSLCDSLAVLLDEIDFLPSSQKTRNVNLRKFRLPNSDIVLDVISYNFVANKEHIVETFDFSINCLWALLKPSTYIGSGMGFSSSEIIDHIVHKKLHVGNNMWFKAGAGRALMRWERFRKDGYTADENERQKYSEYVKMMNTAHT